MKDKIVKLAVLRTNESEACPFGLSIPGACKAAGELINRMAPLELGEDDEEKQDLAAANNRLYMWQCDGTVCKFAGAIFDNRNIVECTWNTSTAGEHSGGAVVGSPFYAKHFAGVGLDGLYTIPLGYYVDTTISRPYYYGQYSFEGASADDGKTKK